MDMYLGDRPREVIAFKDGLRFPNQTTPIPRPEHQVKAVTARRRGTPVGVFHSGHQGQRLGAVHRGRAPLARGEEGRTAVTPRGSGDAGAAAPRMSDTYREKVGTHAAVQVLDAIARSTQPAAESEQ
jgi:hypothetical protein